MNVLKEFSIKKNYNLNNILIKIDSIGIANIELDYNNNIIDIYIDTFDIYNIKIIDLTDNTYIKDLTSFHTTIKQYMISLLIQHYKEYKNLMIV